MITGLRWLLLTAIVMVSCGDRVEAQEPASVSTPGMRIEWTADPARGPWQPVCGYIYNDTPVAPREVRLLVEGRDHSERIIDSRIVPVIGYIALGSHVLLLEGYGRSRPLLGHDRRGSRDR